MPPKDPRRGGPTLPSGAGAPPGVPSAFLESDGQATLFMGVRFSTHPLRPPLLHGFQSALGPFTTIVTNWWGIRFLAGSVSPQ